MDEIKEEFKMTLLHNGEGSGGHCHLLYKKRVDALMEMFNHSAFKVCKFHIEGKK